MKSTYNWCYYLLLNIQEGRDSPLKQFKSAVTNLESREITEITNFARDIIIYRLENLRASPGDSAYGIPGVDIYFLQNQSSGTFRKKLENRTYTPKIPGTMGDFLVQPYQANTVVKELQNNRKHNKYAHSYRK